METFKSYLKQSSTYKGLALLFGLAGYVVAPDAIEVIGIGVAGAIGLVETIRNQRD